MLGLPLVRLIPAKESDFKRRMFGYAKVLQDGHMSIDQIRKEIGLSPYPADHGRYLKIKINMEAISKDGKC